MSEVGSITSKKWYWAPIIPIQYHAVKVLQVIIFRHLNIFYFTLFSTSHLYSYQLPAVCTIIDDCEYSSILAQREINGILLGIFVFPLVKLHTRMSRIYLFESFVNITPDDHAVSSKFENYLYINALKLSITRCARGGLLLTKTWWVNRAYFGLPSHDFHFCLDFSWHHCQILIQQWLNVTTLVRKTRPDQS